MRIIIVLTIYNILLISSFLYTYLFSSEDIKVRYLKDVTGLEEDQAIDVLMNYEITLEYVESSTEKDKVLYTSPKAGELVYDKQMVTLYISKGYLREKYQNIENTLYEDNKEYLNNLVKDYKIELTVTYKKDKTMLDGLISNLNTLDQYVDFNEQLEIVVISNPKTVVLPDFIGKNYVEVLKFAQENDLNIIVEFIPILYLNNHVVGQSVLPGEEVLKNSNPIIIYLSKEI